MPGVIVVAYLWCGQFGKRTEVGGRSEEQEEGVICKGVTTCTRFRLRICAPLGESNGDVYIYIYPLNAPEYS